jgi:hypothetical protein
MMAIMRLAQMFYVLPFLGSCLEATEVKLHLTTDICDLQRVSIYFEGQQGTPVALFDPKPLCPKDLGVLVLVPSGRDNKFNIVVEATKSPDGVCGPTCVKAARSVSYVQHSSLELPVELESSCFGVDCMPGLTCFHGKCVKPDTVCGIRFCDIPDAGPPPPPPDGSVSDFCGGASGKIPLGMALHHWTFDEPTGDFMDSLGMSPVTLAPNFTRSNAAKCGGSVNYGNSMSFMPLGTAVGMPGVGFVAELNVSSTPGGPFPIFAAGRTAPAGWSITGISKGPLQTYQIAFSLLMSGAPTTPVVTTNTAPGDMTWHHVEVSGSGATVRIVIDGNAPETFPLGAPIPSVPLPLELTGADARIGIDNLWIYTGM